VSPLQTDDVAPEIPGVAFGSGPVGLFFYKVTCSTCQMAAPTMQHFDRAFPGRVVGIGQDRASDLAQFADEYEMGIASVEDTPPYPVSDAYAVQSVPTLYLVGNDARVIESVGAWDRDGFNRVASILAELTGGEPVLVSTPGDGHPDFKSG
jgi:thiol-disulfide isomerase/thioredoxin